MMADRLRQVYLRLQAGWRAATPREQRLLGMATLLALLLSLFLLFGWLQTERQRLQRALPLGEARLVSLQAQADEHARLQGQPIGAPLSGSALLDALRISARKRGLALDIQSGEGELQVNGLGKADAALAWLAEITHNHALRPLRLELSRDKFSATLVQATPH